MVMCFLVQVVVDLNVVVIKQMFYCILCDSFIVDVLCEVVEVGKFVIVLVELKVCFDEVVNICQLCRLEWFGVYVVYGLM